MSQTQSKYDRLRIARQCQLPALDDRDIIFASPEDVIIKKMLYYREGESQKHLRDIGGILRIQADKLDRKYIANWSKQFGVEDIWQQIIEQESESD